MADCNCWHRSPSSQCSSSSGSGPSRIPSSASLKPFPASEPSDYCRPTLSVNTRLSQAQRLAVLMDPSLWRRDADATECDTLSCSTNFTLFERKHHCRRCGGIFCQACSGRTVPLLDTSRMPFVHPPAHLPLPLLAASSPTGALVPSRVCDDCYAELSGEVAPSLIRIRTASAVSAPLNTPSSSLESSPSLPLLSHSPGSAGSNGDAHSIASSQLYPKGTTFVAKPRHLRRSGSTSSRKSTTSLARRDSLLSAADARSSSPLATRAPPSTPTHGDLGVLAEYPLKVSSAACKSSGGAWWNPKHIPRRVDSPIQYDAPGARRPSQVQVTVSEEDEDDYEDDGAAPVQPIRRTAVVCREAMMRRATFATPLDMREKHHVTTF